MELDHEKLAGSIRDLVMGERSIQAKAAEEILSLSNSEDIPELNSVNDIGMAFSLMTANAFEPLTGERALATNSEKQRMAKFADAVAAVFLMKDFPADEIAFELLNYIIKAHEWGMQLFSDDAPEILEDPKGPIIFLASIRVFRNMGKSAVGILPQLIETLNCEVTIGGISSGIPAVLAMAAIGSMGELALPYFDNLLEYYYEEGDEYTAKALARILSDSPYALEQVIGKLDSEDEDDIDSCCELLAEVGEKASSAIPKLKQIALANMEYASRSAASALRSIAGNNPEVKSFLHDLRGMKLLKETTPETEQESHCFEREGRNLKEWLQDLAFGSSEEFLNAGNMIYAMSCGIPHINADLEDCEFDEHSDLLPTAIRDVFAGQYFPAVDVFKAIAKRVPTCQEINAQMRNSNWLGLLMPMVVLKHAGPPAAPAVNEVLPLVNKKYGHASDVLESISNMGNAASFAASEIFESIAANYKEFSEWQYAALLAKLISKNEKILVSIGKALSGKDVGRQLVALHVMTEMGNRFSEFTEVVKSLTTSKNKRIRSAAIVALAAIAPQHKDIKEIAFSASRDKNEWISVGGTRALGYLAADEAVFNHLETIAAEHDDYYNRSIAVDAIGLAPVPFEKILPVLRSALKDPWGCDGISPHNSALAIIRKRGEEANLLVPDLIEQLQDDENDWEEIVEALVSMGSSAQQALPALQTMLEREYIDDPFGEDEYVKKLEKTIQTIEQG